MITDDLFILIRYGTLKSSTLMSVGRAFTVIGVMLPGSAAQIQHSCYIATGHTMFLNGRYVLHTQTFNKF